MSWTIQQVDEFEEWFESCDERIQEAIVAVFPLLREKGPLLSRPAADTLKGSKHANMKELRPTSTVRVCFAFDPEQHAILLIGGDKAGKPEDRFYKRLIKKADRLFDAHLASLTQEEKQDGKVD